MPVPIPDQTTSATHPDDVIRARATVEAATPPPGEAGKQLDATSSDSTRERWPRPTRAPKFDRRVPLSGFKLLFSWFLRLLVLIARVLTLGLVRVRRFSNPVLSKKEVKFLAEQAAAEAERERQQAELDERNRCAYESYCFIRALTDKYPHLVVSFVGVKGAAATTTTTVYAASRLAEDTRTLIYGADFNPASGTAGARLGKDTGETVSIQGFADIVDAVRGDRKSVNARLRPTRYGVRVLSADDYTESAGDYANSAGEAYGETTKKMLDVLDENCDYLLIDTPNDIRTPAAQAILEKADIIVFTANVGERDSLRLLRVSMDTVRALGHGRKVLNSIVVISNVPEGASLSDYTKYLGKVNLAHEPTAQLMSGEFNGQMLTVPYDSAIALNGEVDLDALRWETTQAYRDINIAVFEQAEQVPTLSAQNALERS